MNRRHVTHKSRTTGKRKVKDAFAEADKNQLKPMSQAKYDAYMKDVYAQRIINDKKRAEQEQVAASRYASMKKDFEKVEEEMNKKKTTKQKTLDLGNFGKLRKDINKKKIEIKKIIKDVMHKSHSSGEFDHDYFEQQRKLHEKLQKENDRLARR